MYFQMEDHNKDKQCPVCEESVVRVSMHILRAHIPWYAGPITACLDCMKNEGHVEQLTRFHGGHRRLVGVSVLNSWFLLMCGVMNFIIVELGLETFADVLHFVTVEELYPEYITLFSEEECFFFREFDQRAGWTPLTRLEYSTFPPTRPSVIMHYHILVRLLNMLGRASWQKFKTLSHYALPSGFHSPPGHLVLKIGIIDSHFHLDELLRRTGRSFRDLGSSAASNNPLIYAIANYMYVYPRVQVASDPRIKITLRLHPHMVLAQTWQTDLARLRGLTRTHPDFVGIGEVGLDFTTTCKCRTRHNMQQCRTSKIESQRLFLREAILLASTTAKTLVLHVRDNGNGQAAREVLAMLQNMGMTDLPIHRHCFTGDANEYDSWCTALPNCYFGIARASLDNQGTSNTLLLMNRPTRLLLETDSPYLPMGHAIATPWEIQLIANRTAHLMNISASDLIRCCNRNASMLYRLGW